MKCNIGAGANAPKQGDRFKVCPPWTALKCAELLAHDCALARNGLNMCHHVSEEAWTMVYVLAVGAGLSLILLPIITCVAVVPVPFEVPLDPDGIQRAVVEADSYQFTPSHLVVRAGKPVELTVKSVTVLVPHNFVIDDPQSGLAIKEEIPAGHT